jgi:hypothetical protein
MPKYIGEELNKTTEEKTKKGEEMKRDILSAALKLVLLSGCSEDTVSPFKFKRSKHYHCNTLNAALVRPGVVG